MFAELERVAKQTRINKTTISRIALQKFLAQIELVGVGNATLFNPESTRNSRPMSCAEGMMCPSGGLRNTQLDPLASVSW
jgi:hypothetical protein